MASVIRGKYTNAERITSTIFIKFHSAVLKLLQLSSQTFAILLENLWPVAHNLGLWLKKVKVYGFHRLLTRRSKLLTWEWLLEIFAVLFIRIFVLVFKNFSVLFANFRQRV